MKKILFFAFVAFLGIQSVDAQRNGGKRRTPEQMVEMLDKKLDLTEDQEKQITALYTDFFAEKLSREERKTKMEELESLKSATKLFSVLLASKRPLITELADKLRLKYPLLPTISPCPTMRLEAIRSIIPISCRRYPKSV